MSTKYQIIVSIRRGACLTQGNILRKILLKLHFEVLYRRVLFVISIVYYFGAQKCEILRALGNC